MGRKNTFLPKNLKKTKQFKELKYSDKIDWCPSGTTLQEYINYLFDKFPIKSVDDVEELKNYDKYFLIGKFEINSNLKVDTDELSYMYIMCDPEYKTINLSVEKNYPLFWYTFDTRKNFCEMFDKLYESYNPDKYPLAFERNCRGFIGTDDSIEGDMDYITNQFVVNPDTEFLFWGSKWRDYPFRSLFSGRISHKRSLMLAYQAMKQSEGEPYKLNVRTQFSKSIITIEDYNGVYIANIKYKPIEYEGIQNIIKNNLDRDYPTDIPMDAITGIMLFPFLSHKSILRQNNLTNYHFFIASLIANTNEMNEDFEPLAKELIEKHKDDPNIKTMCNNFIKKIKIDMDINKILSDKKITDFIENKLESIQNGKQSLEEVRSEIYEEIEDRVENLKSNDKEAEEQMNNIINNILVTNLSFKKRQ